MLKYLLSAIILSLFITGCSFKSEAHLKFEKDKLVHDLYLLKECRIESTKKLDDGISSVEIIAQAVINDCQKSSQYVINNNMQDKSESFRQSFTQDMNGVKTSGVLGMILKHRSQNK